MTKTSKPTAERLASTCSLVVLLQIAPGCAWKSDLDAARAQVAEQAATVDQMKVEIQSLREEQDRLSKSNQELANSRERLRAEYDGCLPKSERSGSKDSTGRFTARHGTSMMHGHRWALYDGVAFFHTCDCSVGDCSTGVYPGSCSAEELDAIAREWKRIAAGKQ